jgi:hypothetical protein
VIKKKQIPYVTCCSKSETFCYFIVWRRNFFSNRKRKRGHRSNANQFVLKGQKLHATCMWCNRWDKTCFYLCNLLASHQNHDDAVIVLSICIAKTSMNQKMFSQPPIEEEEEA